LRQQTFSMLVVMYRYDLKEFSYRYFLIVVVKTFSFKIGFSCVIGTGFIRNSRFKKWRCQTTKNLTFTKLIKNYLLCLYSSCPLLYRCRYLSCVFRSGGSAEDLKQRWYLSVSGALQSDLILYGLFTKRDLSSFCPRDLLTFSTREPRGLSTFSSRDLISHFVPLSWSHRFTSTASRNFRHNKQKWILWYFSCTGTGTFLMLKHMWTGLKKKSFVSEFILRRSRFSTGT
jgi:hypothetical protein